jgi:hypothetical protein
MAVVRSGSAYGKRRQLRVVGQFESTGAKLGFLSCILGAAVLVWALAFACIAICPNYFVAGSQMKVAGYSKIIKVCTEFESLHRRPEDVTVANESINRQGALTVQNVLVGDVPHVSIRPGAGLVTLYDLPDAKRDNVFIDDWPVYRISRYLYGVLPEKRGGLSVILKFHSDIRELDPSGKQAAFDSIPPDSMHRERRKRYTARNISGFRGRDGSVLGGLGGFGGLFRLLRYDHHGKKQSPDGDAIWPAENLKGEYPTWRVPLGIFAIAIGIFGFMRGGRDCAIPAWGCGIFGVLLVLTGYENRRHQSECEPQKILQHAENVSLDYGILADPRKLVGVIEAPPRRTR